MLTEPRSSRQVQKYRTCVHTINPLMKRLVRAGPCRRLSTFARRDSASLSLDNVFESLELLFPGAENAFDLSRSIRRRSRKSHERQGKKSRAGSGVQDVHLYMSKHA